MLSLFRHTDGASPRRCSGSTPQETAGMRFRLCERWVSSSCSCPDSVLISECSLNLKSNACNKSLAVVPLFIRAELQELELRALLEQRAAGLPVVPPKGAAER